MGVLKPKTDQPDLMAIMNAVVAEGTVAAMAPATASTVHDVELLQNTTMSASGAAPLKDFDAFIALDDCMAALHKDYLTARAQRLALQKQYGADDAMTEMAMDAEESAWAALQTRYIECKADHRLVQAMQDLLQNDRIARQKFDDERRAKAAEHWAAFVRFWQTVFSVQRTRKNQPDIFADLAIIILLQKHLQTGRMNLHQSRLGF